MDRLADRLDESVTVNDLDELTEGDIEGLRDLVEEMDIDLLAGGLTVVDIEGVALGVAV